MNPSAAAQISTRNWGGRIIKSGAKAIGESCGTNYVSARAVNPKEDFGSVGDGVVEWSKRIRGHRLRSMRNDARRIDLGCARFHPRFQRDLTGEIQPGGVVELSQPV